MTQAKLIQVICDDNPNAIIVGSLGSISKDLSLMKHENKVLIKGGMGAAIGCGLGIALNTNRRVIVLIGDGSFLMKMGSISTVLRHNLRNLRIVVINNNQYYSCGGQETNFKEVAGFLPHQIKVIDVFDSLCLQ